MKQLVQILMVLMCFCEWAWAQDLSVKQRLLIPGELIEGHKKLESQCEKCHSPSDARTMTDLCSDCHKKIRADRTTKKGFHGQSPVASVKPCNTCHAEHFGRKADLINMQVETFNHDWTRFPLEGKHEPLACAGCHKTGEKFRKAKTACVSCHKEDDFHKGALGEKCSDCHKPQSWRQIETFDHAKTDFPLLGLHTKVSCNSCHLNQTYEFKDTGCVSCHKAADVHAGKNGDKCDNCHAVEGWKKLKFDHSKTDFALTFKHKEIPCRACHAEGVAEKNTSSACHSCHASTDIHLGRNGKECQNCHTTQGWQTAKFDHAKEAKFPLLGQHAKLVCTRCHLSALTDELPRDCASCHKADDPHKNPEMQLCGTCHVSESWKTTSRFDHHFTNFPLMGMHNTVPCQHCHVGNQFTGTSTDCVSCHKSDDHHKGAMGEKCQTCHSPNSWTLWQFDHKKQAHYELLGAHENLACEACHAPGSKPTDTPKICGNCHKQQDIHNGSFGSDCGRCHSQRKFFELILQD
jgi:hypothetical protein